MNKTKIEWCDSTWNPVTGCRHGCEYCYARRIAERFRPFDVPHVTIDGVLKGINDLAAPIITECKDGKERVCAYPYGFEPTFHRYKLEQPKKWRYSRTVFVCSMADLFGDWVPDSWIKEVFAACEKAPQHIYLFLTKNPRRYKELYKNDLMPKDTSMWNKWYGCTITKPEDEFFWIDENSRGIDHHGFLSIEPILADFPTEATLPRCIRWIIIGAESGSSKNKVIPKKEWIEHICEVADKSNISVFIKDSLIPIVGEENMRREFPWERRNW